MNARSIQQPDTQRNHRARGGGNRGRAADGDTPFPVASAVFGPPTRLAAPPSASFLTRLPRVVDHPLSGFVSRDCAPRVRRGMSARRLLEATSNGNGKPRRAPFGPSRRHGARTSLVIALGRPADAPAMPRDPRTKPRQSSQWARPSCFVTRERNRVTQPSSTARHSTRGHSRRSGLRPPSRQPRVRCQRASTAHACVLSATDAASPESAVHMADEPPWPTIPPSEGPPCAHTAACAAVKTAFWHVSAL
jgi:hypothetical protein